MLPSDPTLITQARQRYAERLRDSGVVQSQAVVHAFARVPRERFLGPPPWMLLSPNGAPPAETSDPRDLYRNVLVAIDRNRKINNGEPRMWAFLDDLLALAPGERVVHVGAGTGYYSAILAEIVGAQGRVIAIEIEPDLAERTGKNLAPWPQARAIAADGFSFRPDSPMDAVVVNAGVTALSSVWLDTLAANGRLLVPMTTPHWTGAFLLITRRGSTNRYAVRCACATSIIPCAGAPEPGSESRLNAALARAGFDAIRSLRRPPEEPDDTAWLTGNGWWFSTASA